MVEPSDVEYGLVVYRQLSAMNLPKDAVYFAKAKIQRRMTAPKRTVWMAKGPNGREGYSISGKHGKVFLYRWNARWWLASDAHPHARVPVLERLTLAVYEEPCYLHLVLAMLRRILDEEARAARVLARISGSASTPIQET